METERGFEKKGRCWIGRRDIYPGIKSKGGKWESSTYMWHLKPQDWVIFVKFARVSTNLRENMEGCIKRSEKRPRFKSKLLVSWKVN